MGESVSYPTKPICTVFKCSNRVENDKDAFCKQCREAMIARVVAKRLMGDSQ